MINIFFYYNYNSFNFKYKKILLSFKINNNPKIYIKPIKTIFIKSMKSGSLNSTNPTTKHKDVSLLSCDFFPIFFTFFNKIALNLIII